MYLNGTSPQAKNKYLSSWPLILAASAITLKPLLINLIFLAPVGSEVSAPPGNQVMLSSIKFSGISLIKLDKGVDTGKIVFVKKLINKDKSYKQIDKEIYYKYKLYLYEKIFLLLKLGKKIPFQKHSKKFPQYFKMNKKLIKLIK